MSATRGAVVVVVVVVFVVVVVLFVTPVVVVVAVIIFVVIVIVSTIRQDMTRYDHIHLVEMDKQRDEGTLEILDCIAIHPSVIHHKTSILTD